MYLVVKDSPGIELKFAVEMYVPIPMLYVDLER